MSLSYNLIEEPWIPCSRLDRKVTYLGIRQLLSKSHELREVHSLSPLVVAAVHRMLLAILHRVYGPEKRSAWGAIWQAGSLNTDRLNVYLDTWKHRFDLFDSERPFYQAADERVEPKSVISLIPHLASGNNATLFDHSTEEIGAALAPAQAAQALLAAQSFGLAGLSGLPERFTDAPCARGIAFLIQGQTLFETLVLNLIQYDPEKDKPIPSEPGDMPAWEMDDPFADNRQIPLGYLDYLTWQSRRVMLLPEQELEGVGVRQMTMAPGLRFNSNLVREGVFFDPTNHYRKDNKRGCLVLRFQEGRALWRDSSSLFQVKVSGDHEPPYVFSWLSRLVGDYLEESQIFRFMALGMASRQARVDFYRQEHMPLPLAYLEKPELVGELSSALQMAEQTRGKLWGAVRRMANLLISPTADDEGGRRPDPSDVSKLTEHWGIERNFWGDLEIHYLALLENLPADPEATLTHWQNVLRQTAWTALEYAERMAGDDVAALKAAVRGREQLAYGLSQVFPSEPEKEANP